MVAKKHDDQTTKVRDQLYRGRKQNSDILEEREKQHGRDLLHTFKMMQHTNDCIPDDFELNRAKSHIDHQFAKINVRDGKKPTVSVPHRLHESYDTIYDFNSKKFRYELRLFILYFKNK